MGNETIQTSMKGPFWVVTDSDSVVAYPVAPEVEPVPSHREVWDIVRGRIKKPWNYYPRGRVELRRGRAVVFLNPLCLEYPPLEKQLRESFSLGNMSIEFKADNSRHYSQGVYGED